MTRLPNARDTRRIARDQEGIEKLNEILGEGDVDFADLLATLIEHAPEDKRDQVTDAVRKLGQDSRGPRAWARDRLEMRRLSRDAGPALQGADPPVEQFYRPEGTASAELSGAKDARGIAMDAQARRSSSFAKFRARYPGADRIESGGW